jgi:iron complex outermembrane receptor protein
VGVRGLQLLGDANTRILVLIDGTPLNEPWAQFVDTSTALPVSLDDVARIEVIRGPVSSIYGTNAFFGIINIVTLEADKAPRAYGRASIDSFGSAGGNAAFNAGTLNRQARGTFSFKERRGETLNYSDLPTQRTSADGGRAYFGSLALTYDRLFFQARGYDRTRELPGAPYDSAVGSEENKNRDRHVLAELGYTHEIGERVNVAGRVYGNRYAFTSNLLRSDGLFNTKADATWFGGEIRVLGEVLEKEKLLNVTTGVSYEQTTTRSSASTRPGEIVTDFNIAGVYLEAATEPVSWFAATAGARFDRNSEFTNELSPRAAVFLRKGESYGLKLLYAAGFRNPSILEAYYDDDERFSPALDMDSRTQLRPETIRAYEVVAYGRPFAGAKLRVSAWEWRLADLLKRDEIFDPVDNEPRLRYQNTATLVSRGVEIESTYRDLAGRSAYLNAAFAFTGRNCLDSNGFDNLLLDAEKGNCDARQNAPVIVAQAGLSSQLLLKLFHLSGELTYISARGTQDPDVSVPAFVGANVVAYAPNIQGIDVTLGVRNLLEREEVPAQSDYNRLMPRAEVLRVPGPGREIFLRMGYQF